VVTADLRQVVLQFVDEAAGGGALVHLAGPFLRLVVVGPAQLIAAIHAGLRDETLGDVGPYERAERRNPVQNHIDDPLRAGLPLPILSQRARDFCDRCHAGVAGRGSGEAGRWAWSYEPVAVTAPRLRATWRRGPGTATRGGTG